MSDRERWSQWAKDHPDPRAPVRMAKANKYHATKVQIDGLWFDSQREAARYQELKFLIVAGEIANLEVHPAFALMVPELSGDELPVTVLHTIGWYHADFQYRNLRTGNVIVEDVKSQPTKTEAYTLRKKFVEAQYGITIVEIT